MVLHFFGIKVIDAEALVFRFTASSLNIGVKPYVVVMATLGPQMCFQTVGICWN